MELAYAAADLVVGRAGANTVSEITALGLPAVYVPLPIGNGEQRLNAQPVVAAGGGLLVDDAAFDARLAAGPPAAVARRSGSAATRWAGPRPASAGSTPTTSSPRWSEAAAGAR